MKTTYRIILLLVLLAAGSLATCSIKKDLINTPTIAPVQDSGLVLGLQLDKSVYRIGMPVIAHLKLENVESKDIITKNRMVLNNPNAPAIVTDTAFVIISPLGLQKFLRDKVSVLPLSNGNFQILRAGDAVQATYDLANNYSLEDVGVYSVYAIYQNQSNSPNGLVAWKGKIQSPTIAFTIEP